MVYGFHSGGSRTIEFILAIVCPDETNIACILEFPDHREQKPHLTHTQWPRRWRPLGGISGDPPRNGRVWKHLLPYLYGNGLLMILLPAGLYQAPETRRFMNYASTSDRSISVRWAGVDHVPEKRRRTIFTRIIVDTTNQPTRFLTSCWVWPDRNTKDAPDPFSSDGEREVFGWDQKRTVPPYLI